MDMRTIVNISLPQKLARDVQNEVKRGKFASTSEFFRHLLRTYLLAQELESMRKEFDAGKGIKLQSLADLD